MKHKHSLKSVVFAFSVAFYLGFGSGRTMAADNDQGQKPQLNDQLRSEDLHRANPPSPLKSEASIESSRKAPPSTEPPVIDPGRDGVPPSDAIVLFNGKDLSQWK